MGLSPDELTLLIHEPDLFYFQAIDAVAIACVWDGESWPCAGVIAGEADYALVDQ